MTPSHPQLPMAAWQVIDLLQQRAPGVQWNPGRVARLVADFSELDALDVAAECADWITHRSSGRVGDGPATLHRFLRRRRAESDAATVLRIERPREDDLEQYDRFSA